MADRTATTEPCTEGRAYEHVAGQPDLEIALTGRETAPGRLLRRYWQPIARTNEVADLPLAIKVLGEELVLFRCKAGVGLVYPRCIHRGASLLHGKIEPSGLRCCYHGWLFDPEGSLIEAPCEPGGAVPAGLRQPWYPVVERFGLIWTYMGPADKQPPFPRFPWTERLPAEAKVVAGGAAILDETRGIFPEKQDFNWWHLFDNLMDPFHLYVLHSRISGYHFGSLMSVLPVVAFQPLSNGVVSVARREGRDGTRHYFVSHSLLPNVSCSTPVGCGGGPMMIWIVPRDDTSYRTFTLTSSEEGDPPVGLDDFRPWVGPDKPAAEWTDEDHQRWPTDYTVLKGMGPIALHSEEHLTTIDRGISLMRRLFKRQVQSLAEGHDPVGACRQEPYVLDPVCFTDAEIDQMLAKQSATASSS